MNSRINFFLVFTQIYHCVAGVQTVAADPTLICAQLWCPTPCNGSCNQISLEREFLDGIPDLSSASLNTSASKSASLVLLSKLLHLSGTVCKSDKPLCLPTDTQCQITELLAAICSPVLAPQPATSSLQDQPHNGLLDLVLRSLSQILRRDHCTTYFNAASVLLESHFTCEDNATISNLSVAILSRLTDGQCIASLPSKSTNTNSYEQDIFQKYGAGDDHNVIDSYGLALLMEDLGIEKVDETRPPKPGHEDHGHDDHADHSHQPESGSSRRVLRSAEMSSTATANQLQAYAFENSNSTKGSAKDAIFEYDVDGSHTIDVEEFLQMCPYFIYKMTDMQETENTTEPQENGVSRAMAYGLGTVATLIVSLGSVLGFFILPCLRGNIYEYFMASFIALAYGTLLGDAMLHLIPEALNLESLEEDESKVPTYFWKMFTLMMVCYGLFVIETFSEFIANWQQTSGGRQHSHHGHSHIVHLDVEQISKDQKSPSIVAEIPNSGHPDVAKSFGATTAYAGITGLAWMIILGDGIHNVADGLAIGAAFSTSTSSGLSTSLAVFFHEIPHELGDFAILIATGMSFKKALLLNFLSTLTAFVGLYIGVAVGNNENASQWIFIVTAAIFITVSMGSMLPEMKNFQTENRGRVLIALNIGALVGMAVMTLLAVFEGTVNF